jgi:hypothetical protein
MTSVPVRHASSKRFDISDVYIANDRHGSDDREYRFVYSYTYDTAARAYSWHARIVRMPDLRGRDASTHRTYRWKDEDGQYWVSWDYSSCPATSPQEMQAIAHMWADHIQEYIATGKHIS